MIKNYDGSKSGSFEILEEIDPGVLGVMHKESGIAYVVDTRSKKIHCIHPVHFFEKKGDPWPSWDSDALAMFYGGLIYGPKKETLISRSRCVEKIFDKYTRWSAEKCKCGGECLTAKQEILDVLSNNKDQIKSKELVEELIEDARQSLDEAMKALKEYG